jgi:hypothetical protein
LFGNNNDPELLDSKPDVIKNAFTLEFMSLTFLINLKPLTIGHQMEEKFFLKKLHHPHQPQHVLRILY